MGAPPSGSRWFPAVPGTAREGDRFPVVPRFPPLRAGTTTGNRSLAVGTVIRPPRWFPGARNT